MNLSGFCSADRKDCGAIPPRDAYAAALDSPYAGAAQTIGSTVGSMLYRIAAAAGKNVVCPTLPVLGRVAGIALASALLPAELALNLPGIGLAVTTETLGGVVGEHVGAATRKELCGY